MAINDDTRTPEAIERDIEQTRSQMADTLDDLQRRLSPGQLMDRALGYLEEKSGDIGSDLVATVKQNPIPITLVGIGVAWLAMVGLGRSSKHASTAHSHSAGGFSMHREDYETPTTRGGYAAGGQTSTELHGPEHTLGEKAFTERRLGSDRRISSFAGGTGYRVTGEGAGPGSGTTERRQGERRTAPVLGQGMGEQHLASGMGSQARETVRETAGTVREKAGEVQHKLGGAMHETVETVREKAGEMQHKASEALGQVRHKTAELSHQAGDRARELSHKAQEQISYLAHEQPLVLAALGIAVGAAIGASLPRTRPENELMGGARDELMQRAEETGSEMLHEVRERMHSESETGQPSWQSPREPGMEGRREYERAESGPIAAGSVSGGTKPEREWGQTGGT
jgi:ElaB/YqjD/DUF883 family membrane-anchored ribosome-binding protein